MNGEPVPDLAADFLTKRIGQGFALVRVEIVHDQVNVRFRQACVRKRAGLFLGGIGYQDSAD